VLSLAFWTLMAASVVVPLVAWRRGIRRNLVFAIPAINVLADMLLDYAQVGGWHTGHLRALLMALFIAVLLPRLRWNATNTLLFGFLFYLFLLLGRSSDPAYSGEMWLRLVVALGMLPVAFSLVRTPGDLRRLNVGVVVSVLIGVLYIAASQVFQWGTKLYGDNSLYFARGGQDVYVTYFIAYTLVLLPLMFEVGSFRAARSRLAAGSIALSALLVLLLAFRRGSIFGMVGGALVYSLMTRHRARAMRIWVVAVLVLGAGYPLYGDRLEAIARDRDITAYVSDTEIGRMAEFGIVTREFLNNGPAHALFGSELFNSRVYLQTHRTLHVDYTNLLLGAGLVGLVMYLALYARLLVDVRQRARRLGALPAVREIKAAFFGLVTACLIISLSNQLWSVAPLSLVFLYLGALLGVLDGMEKRAAAVPAARAAAPPARVPAGTLRPAAASRAM
jgi:hypothetical protein